VLTLQPMDDTRFGRAKAAVLDLETTVIPAAYTDTGKPEHRIIEIGVGHVDLADLWGARGTAWAVPALSTMVWPECATSWVAQEVNGIRPSQLADAPTMADVWPQVCEVLDGRVLVAHHLPFDALALIYEADRIGQPFEFGGGVCTRSLVAAVDHGATASLGPSLARRDITLDGAHRADADALGAARLLRNVLGTWSSQWVQWPLKDVWAAMKSQGRKPDSHHAGWNPLFPTRAQGWDELLTRTR